MATQDHRRIVDEIVREIDLLVFRLEQPPAAGVEATQERARLCRDLERLRDRLQEVADGLW